MNKWMLCTLALGLSACGGGGAGGPATGITPTPAPVPPLAATEVALFAGKTYYQQTCVACHGPDPTANVMRIRSNGANNPSAIINAFNSFVAMSNLKGQYTLAELTAIAAYLAEPTAPPGGLFVGYYQEDASSNPEDPVPGAVYLGLPDGEDKFSGNMYFTYFGCQSSNVGKISGNKTLASLNGNWSGSIDNTPQSGSYSGTYDVANILYSGTYTVASGKQLIDIPGCIKYSIAPNGSWSLFPVEQNTPATFTPSVNANTLVWSTPAGYATALVSVMDVAAAVTINGSNAVKVQSQVFAPLANFDLTPFALTSGKPYLAVVNAFDSSRVRIGAGSKRFIAP
jgi:mono/diheme cytochrome c family protein